MTDKTCEEAERSAVDRLTRLGLMTEASRQLVTAMVESRDEEMGQLRAQRDVALHSSTELGKANVEWQKAQADALKRAFAAEAERDALKAAIETLSARHQPTIAKNLIRCDRHVNMRRVSWEELRDCSDCRDEPITVCSNLTCCEYPCEDRRAIDAALAAREETGRG